MLFTSYEFIGFLLIVFLLYYILPKKCQWPLLLVASYIFYFMADPRYLIFILVTTISTYLVTMKIQKKKDAFGVYFASVKKGLSLDEKKALKAKEKNSERGWMLFDLLLNLGILAVIKYTNFTIVNINSLLHTFGSSAEISRVDWVLPMGISFYTFQTMGYLIDVYRGKHPAEKNPFKLALFVAFFPQLVQGPISRFSDLSKSLFEQHKADYRTISFGIQRLLWGFFKKLVIADRIVVAVNQIIGDTETYNGVFVLVGMLFYALELYADFTGGIDITIGVAQVCGIEVTENFKRPYFSKNIKEYWNRWHITMGSWFTDYIFYPLSVSGFMQKVSKSSRKHLGDKIGKRVPVYLSSFVVWFATGIWHGASWNFIVWGLGNFVVIMISQELEPFYRWFHSKVRVEGTLGWKIFRVVRTVLLMSCLRMFDCYRDVPLTFKMFWSMLSTFNWGRLFDGTMLSLGLTVTDYIILACGTLLLFAVSMLQRKRSVREQIAALPVPVRFIIWYGLFMVILIIGSYGIGFTASQFIYNQF